MTIKISELSKKDIVFLLNNRKNIQIISNIDTLVKINTRTKISVKFPCCKITQEIYLRNAINGSNCSICNRVNNLLFATNSKKITQTEFVEKIKKRFNGEYTVMGQYNAFHIPIEIRHNKCNNIWNIRPRDILKDKPNKCPNCSHPSKRKDPLIYEKEFYELNGTDYKLLDKYVTNKTKLRVLHLKCGNIHSIIPNTYSKCKYNCKICNHKRSKAEEIVSTFLINEKIAFIKEKTFKNLKNIHALKLDFFIPEFNIAIECDGEHHFHVTRNRSKQDLLNQQIRDNIKNKYCKDNNIYLIRIPYYEDTLKYLLIELDKYIINLS